VKQIETTRRRTQTEQDDWWTINVIGLTSEEAMAISGFVSQLIVKRTGGFENYVFGKGVVIPPGGFASGGIVPPANLTERVAEGIRAAVAERVRAAAVKAPTQEPLTKPREPGNRFSGLDLSTSTEASNG
jgi:hypothetical protein